MMIVTFLYTSGCPWPLATVKSPGFFKLGLRFSFFKKLFIFLFFYFYVFFIFIIILWSSSWTDISSIPLIGTDSS
jgi:hypothetical protein